MGNLSNQSVIHFRSFCKNIRCFKPLCINWSKLKVCVFWVLLWMWNAPPCWIYGKGSHPYSLHSGAPFISSRISSFQKMSLLMTLNLACLIGPVNYVIGAGTVFLLAPKAMSAPWHQGGWRGRKCRKCWNGLVVERKRSQWMLSLFCRMLTHKL